MQEIEKESKEEVRKTDLREMKKVEKILEKIKQEFQANKRTKTD